MGWLGVECRDPDLMLTSFWVVEANSGSFLLVNLQVPEPWWVGLEAVREGCLYLHGFADRKTGQHGGIAAHTVPGGALRWQQPLLQFQGLRQGQILAWDLQNREAPVGVALNAGTGLVVANNIPLDHLLPVAEASRFSDEKLGFPIQYPEGSEYFQIVRDFLQGHHPRQPNPSMALDYLETDQSIYIGYYTGMPAGGWQHHMAMFSGQGVYEGEVKLSQLANGVGEAGFFRFGGKLFLIQDRKSLLCFVI